jgi:hypothetical protein
MAKPWEILSPFLVWMIDNDGVIQSNIYVSAPSISWVMNFFKGVLLPGYSIVVEDANNSTFDSSKWKEDRNANVE